jgi:hypothetical protein
MGGKHQVVMHKKFDIKVTIPITSFARGSQKNIDPLNGGDSGT